jgi:hypothetical protein
MGSRVEILWTPGLTAKSPARDLASKKSFAVLRVFKIPLLIGSIFQTFKSATLRWEEFPKRAVPGDIALRPRQI